MFPVLRSPHSVSRGEYMKPLAATPCMQSMRGIGKNNNLLSIGCTGRGRAYLSRQSHGGDKEAAGLAVEIHASVSLSQRHDIRVVVLFGKKLETTSQMR